MCPGYRPLQSPAPWSVLASYRYVASNRTGSRESRERDRDGHSVGACDSSWVAMTGPQRQKKPQVCTTQGGDAAPQGRDDDANRPRCTKRLRLGLVPLRAGPSGWLWLRFKDPGTDNEFEFLGFDDKPVTHLPRFRLAGVVLLCRGRPEAVADLVP